MSSRTYGSDADKLVRELAKQFKKPTFTDLTIETATESIPCSKHILCLQSKYFVKAFTGPFKEGSSNTLSLKDDDSDAIHCMIEYCYTFKYTEKDSSKALELHAGVFAVAEKYLIPALVAQAAENFAEALKDHERDDYMQDLCAAIAIAWTDTLDTKQLLRPAIIKLVKSKRTKFVESADFVATMENTPAFASDVAVAFASCSHPELLMREFRCPCGCGAIQEMIIPPDEMTHVHRCFSGRQYVAYFVGKIWQEYLVHPTLVMDE